MRNQQKQSWIIDPNIFFQKGMSICKKRYDAALNKSNMRAFRARFGVSPGVCSVVWDLIVRNSRGASGGSSQNFVLLLWALLFLKTYATEAVLASMTNVDAKTFRNQVWPMIELIASLKPHVVSTHYTYSKSSPIPLVPQTHSNFFLDQI